MGADKQGVKHTGIIYFEIFGNTLFRMEQRGIGLLRGWVVDRVRAGQTECEKPAPPVDLNQFSSAILQNAAAGARDGTISEEKTSSLPTLKH